MPNNGSSYYANWGWWGYGWSATVNAAEGYTITKCIFYDNDNRTATDSEAPFVVETTEEDKTPQVNGTPILANQSKGIKKIEVYGYATPAHTHDFTYSASGATITAKCTAAGCNLPESSAGAGDHVATLTISANGGTYDGTTAYGATITDANSIQGDAKVQYQKKTDGSYGTATETAPKDAGDYKASITVGGATASVEYNIAKADSTANAPTGLTATYGQTLANVSLEGKNPEGNTPGTWAWADSTKSVGNVVDPAATFKANFTPTSSNYKTVENVDVTVTVGKAASPATVTGTATVIKGGNTVDLANNVTKNGATGDVGYAIDGEANGCTLNGSVLTSGNTTGTVTVNVTVATDENYNALGATPITVTINAVPVTDVTLNTSSTTIAVNGVVTLTATVSPNDATDKKVIWSVSASRALRSSPAVKLYADAGCTNEVGTDATETLTVYAKGISEGNATVTVTSNANSNKFATCALAVRDIPDTGDGADFGLWAVMLAIGLAGMGFALTMGKRRKARQ